MTSSPEELRAQLEELRRRVDQTHIAARELEGSKMMVDVAKHLTTLSSGSILLLTTLLSDVFPRDVFTGQDVVCKWLQVPILLAFLAALLCAVAVAWIVPLRVWYGPRQDQEGEMRLASLQMSELRASKARSWLYRLSAISFFVGVLLLSVFAAVNFGTPIPCLECDN